MKFLVVDHFSTYDIEAFRRVCTAHVIRVVAAFWLNRIARKHLPAAAYSGNMGEAYGRPEFAEARHRHAMEARRILHEIYLSFPFDAVIVPSDTILYLRPWAASAHELGVPYIVMQKETTISPYTLTEDARVVGQALPFIGDLMLVCSDLHKQFWLNTGAEAKRIIVTGQPRFDFYRQPEQWKTLQDLGINRLRDRPTILFFSYDVGAYSPEGVLAPTWLQLRSETEGALIALARDSGFNLLIKPHPQQQGLQEDRKRLRCMAGGLWGRAVQLLPGSVDARQLIVNAECVVGFQTTAMLEAMAAGKRIVYTFWTESALECSTGLIPFHLMVDTLCIARSPEELKSLVQSGRGVEDPRLQVGRYEAEKYLGPLDGQSSERCLRVVEGFIREYTLRVDASAITFRRSLDDRSSVYCREALPRARRAATFWRLLRWLLPLAYPLWMILRNLRHGGRVPAGAYQDYRDRVTENLDVALQTIHYCRPLFTRSERSAPVSLIR